MSVVLEFVKTHTHTHTHTHTQVNKGPGLQVDCGAVARLSPKTFLHAAAAAAAEAAANRCRVG